jgi:hypothetical protein
VTAALRELEFAASAVGRVVVAGDSVEALQARLRGPLLHPGEAGYDDARKVFNGLIDRRPALIARCVGAADVIAAVTFARENGLLVSINIYCLPFGRRRAWNARIFGGPREKSPQERINFARGGNCAGCSISG